MANFEWKNVSREKWREYIFAEGVVRIEEPKKITVTPSGSHRVITKQGLAYYVRAGFLAIRWEGPILF